MSAHSATQVQEAGGRGDCGRDHRGYACRWGTVHLGQRRLRLAPRLPSLVEAVLQVAAVPLLLQLHARRELHVLPLQLPHLGASEWAAG